MASFEDLREAAEAALKTKALHPAALDPASVLRFLDEYDVHRKRLGEQRKQLGHLTRKLETLEQPLPDPDVTEVEVAERQATYLVRVEQARMAGHTDWLAEEVVRHDRDKQRLLTKMDQLRQDRSSITRLRRERDGLGEANGELRKQLEGVRVAFGILDRELHGAGVPANALLRAALFDLRQMLPKESLNV